MPDDRARWMRLLEDFARARSSILAAYIFGSRARGAARAWSDLDVALLLDARQGSLPGGSTDRGAMLDDWGTELGALAGMRIDLVDLDRCSIVLRHQIVSSGCRAFERDRPRVREFEARTIAEYLDFKPIEDLLVRRAVSALGQRARW